eukprot:CAMPEP_0182454264 /NCGR_PEP_ID=MMETSP1319-20130603/977_1 /TAXON_ID=172717 /ORGANISM="Bolidomonas pacifica, Strain RCC208" /LENGTH=241 /DNA_ID=CAMNT_0024652265 /DNA_START=285 /DNA_END=1006 /DNA_ORIENTATION=+
MEGGMLAWKRQSDKSFANSAQYNDMNLPQQVPEGKEWFKKEDGTYELRSKNASESTDEKGSSDPSSSKSSSSLSDFVLHKVNRNLDTLEGLCLRYKTNRRELQRLNSFSGSSLDLAPDVLKIPPGAAGARQQTGEERSEAEKAMERQMILVNFTALHPDLSAMEARLYLDDAGWSLEAANASVASDVAWEASGQGERAGRKNSRFNDKMDRAEALVSGEKKAVEKGLKGIKMVNVTAAEGG